RQGEPRRSGGGLLELRVGGRRRRARAVPGGVLARRKDPVHARPAAPRPGRLLESRRPGRTRLARNRRALSERAGVRRGVAPRRIGFPEDRKSTRLNSSHQIISYAVFCLKKKTQND